MSVEAITNRTLPEVDDMDVDWRPLAEEALQEHLGQMPVDKAVQMEKKLDQLALTSANLEARYDLPDSGPKDLNYDIIFNAVPPANQKTEAASQAA